MEQSDQVERARRSGVQSIEQGGALLEALVKLGGPSSLSQIASACGMPSAKAHRYLTSLCEIDLTVQLGSGKYALGPLALRLGLSAISQHDMIERAFEVMTGLCHDLLVSGHLSIWTQNGPVVIRSSHGGAPVISPVAVGSVLPLIQSASGRIYLSHMTAAATDELRKLQEPLLTEQDAVVLKEETLTAGYALSRGDYIPGLGAIACPIFNHDNSLAGAVTFVTTNLDTFTSESRPTQHVLDGMKALRDAYSLA